MIKGPYYQEGIILNVYASNQSFKSMGGKTELKGKTDQSTITGNFQLPQKKMENQ